jgi:hypothetical protein
MAVVFSSEMSVNYQTAHLRRQKGRTEGWRSVNFLTYDVSRFVLLLPPSACFREVKQIIPPFIPGAVTETVACVCFVVS